MEIQVGARAGEPVAARDARSPSDCGGGYQGESRSKQIPDLPEGVLGNGPTKASIGNSPYASFDLETFPTTTVPPDENSGTGGGEPPPAIRERLYVK